MISVQSDAQLTHEAETLPMTSAATIFCAPLKLQLLCRHPRPVVPADRRDAGKKNSGQRACQGALHC